MDKSLPDRCYAILNTTGELIVIDLGQRGYYTTSGHLTGEEAKKVRDKMNKTLGVTSAQRIAMEYGSMFGWDVPAAYAKEWEGKECEAL